MTVPEISDLLRALMESTADHVYFKDRDSRFLLVSASLARSLGHPIEEIVGRTDFDFFDAEQASAFREAELKIMSTGEADLNRTVKHAWSSGRETWSLHDAMPLRNEHGEIIGVWGTNKDITTSKLLEQTVNARTVELEAANSQLAKTNGELAAETERANVMTERAVAETHAKTEFLAVVSHDIRNPFQAIMSSAELLQDTPLDPMQRDYVETIEEVGRTTLSLVNDLLDMSKAEAGRLELDSVEFNLPGTLEDVARLLALKAHAQQIEFIVDVDPQVPEYVMGDPARLRQVLLNLAFNAVKFTAHGEVAVEVRVAESSSKELMLHFQVRDTGIGIPPDRLQSLFQPYCQGDLSITRRYGGTGLGLFIVHRIVALMAGTTGVESVEGSGSTFWFTARFLRPSSPDPRHHSAAPAMNGRVLVVDDNASQRRVLTRQLQQHGLDATSASSAAEALTVLHQAYVSRQPFAAALVDHRMPETDGAQLAAQITADPELNSTRLVLLTSNRPMHAPFAELGIAACLAKPVAQRDLIDCLQLVLAGSAGDWHAHTSPIVTQTLLRAHRGRAKRHILVAEDTPASRKVACRTLERLGYRATGVANGREAVTAWESGRYHLILMDWEMPELSGPDATRIIRSREGPGSHIPIIALTGRVLPGTELECKKAGMDGFLAKPIDRDGLEACLARFLSECLDTTGERPSLPPGVATHDLVPIDLAAVRELAGGDETWLRGVLDDFTQQGATAVIDMDAALAIRNSNSLAQIAHALKGTADGLKAHGLRQSAAELELAARQGAVEQYMRLVDRVREDVARIREYLRE